MSLAKKMNPAIFWLTGLVSTKLFTIYDHYSRTLDLRDKIKLFTIHNVWYIPSILTMQFVWKNVFGIIVNRVRDHISVPLKQVIYGINRLLTASCNSLSLFLRLEPFVYIGNDKKGTKIRTDTLIGTTT